MNATAETKAKVDFAAGSIPAARTTPFKPKAANQPFAQSELLQPDTNRTKFRSQSSPKAARLTKRDLRDLMRLCDVEIGHCGLDQETGRRALELKEKLAGIHAHGSA